MPMAAGSERFQPRRQPSIHFPPVQSSIAPRYSPSVPRVATIAGMRSPTTRKPLNAPPARQSTAQKYRYRQAVATVERHADGNRGQPDGRAHGDVDIAGQHHQRRADGQQDQDLRAGEDHPQRLQAEVGRIQRHQHGEQRQNGKKRAQLAVLSKIFMIVLQTPAPSSDRG